MRGLNGPLFLFLYLFSFFPCSFLCFLLSLCFFYAFYYKNTMDECKYKILVVLVFIMAIHQVIAQVVSLQQIVIT